MNFFEQQANYNPNMPLRGLGYISDSLKEYLAETHGDQKGLFSENLIQIPTPKYYVFYNGSRNQPEELELRLSKAYNGEGDIEVIAHMLNINKGHNRQLLEACKPLGDYSELVYRVRCNKSEGQSDTDAVESAVDSCIKDGILADVLRKERAKVKNILIAGLTEKQQKELIEMEKERAIKEAVEEAVKEAVKEAAKKNTAEKVRLVNKLITDRGETVESACELVEITVEDYHKHQQTEKSGN